MDRGVGHGGGGPAEPLAPGLFDVVDRRRSRRRLIDPGPSRAELTRILESAVRAPDHKRLRPWRFTVFTGQARRDFGDVLATGLLVRDPAATPEEVERHRGLLLRAPVVLAVGMQRQASPVTADEQLAAVAAATATVLLAATALGYGSVWRTGQPGVDPVVKQALGLGEADALVGFVYLGTIPEDSAPPPRPEAALSDVVTYWPSSGGSSG